ncbi:MAG: hypothetical protein Q4B87_00810 [Candidatus Saccharibacteria bacterium]|nr:hypothetical protein [Candidatus Saccharibacteria bacterium]
MGETNNSKRKRKFDLKTWVLVGCAVVALVAVVAIIVGFNFREKYTSDYFHDADGRFVVTMDYKTAALENGPYEPFITHVVYYYDGEKITDAKAFYEYANNQDATEAYNKMAVGEYFDGISLNDRFVVLSIKKTQYEGVTLADLKASRDQLKGIDAVILDYDDKTLSKYGTWSAGITTDFDNNEEANKYRQTASEDEGNSGSSDSSNGGESGKSNSETR